MKKTLLSALSITISMAALAQQKPAFTPDSTVQKQLNYKIDTGLFNNKALNSQLLNGNNLALAQTYKMQPLPAMMANNAERITYSKVDHMPVLNTYGKSKMPVANLQGFSKMPVTGKGQSDRDTVMLNRRP